MIRRDIDRPDIQAIAYTGFGSLSGAGYMLLRVRVVDARVLAAALSSGKLAESPVEDLERRRSPK